MSSTTTVRFAVLLAALGASLSGQRLSVLSEFQRVGPDGAVVKADRVPRPREIISPAVPRNGWLTLRIVVEAPKAVQYNLYIGQNPDNTAQYTLYQEQYTTVGDEWIPDKLKPVATPHGAMLTEGQKVQTYLLDIFIPPKTPSGRFRMEAQLNVGDHWVIYPMEIRVREMTAPGKAEARGTLAPVAGRADQYGEAPLRSYLCGGKAAAKEAAQPVETLRAVALRNAAQDVEIAMSREKAETHEGVGTMIAKAAGHADLDAMCKSKGPAPNGAEWWLKARDFLYQGVPIH